MLLVFWSSTWPFLSPLADVLGYMTQSILKVYTDQSVIYKMHGFFLYLTALWTTVFPLSLSTACCSCYPLMQGLCLPFGVSQHSEIWWVKRDLLLFLMASAHGWWEETLSPFSCISIYSFVRKFRKLQVILCWAISHLHFPSEMRSTPLWHMLSSITAHHSSPNYSCYKLATQMARKSEKKTATNLEWTECKHYVSCSFISMLLENEEFPP